MTPPPDATSLCMLVMSHARNWSVSSPPCLQVKYCKHPPPPGPNTKNMIPLDISFSKCVRLIALFESGLSYVNKINYLQLICC